MPTVTQFVVSVMSQLELTLIPSSFRPYQERFCPVPVTSKSIERFAVLFTKLAETPGGKAPRAKFAMLPSAAPVYLMSGNCPFCKPKPEMLMMRAVPGADRLPLALMAGVVGLATNVP